MSAVHREMCMCGYLQLKETKKKTSWKATFAKESRKKTVYKTEQYVVLCIHDDRIPLLEWYPAREQAEFHLPDRVDDLLFCERVQPVIDGSNGRSFVITFDDGRSLELCALNAYVECAS